MTKHGASLAVALFVVLVVLVLILVVLALILVEGRVISDSASLPPAHPPTNSTSSLTSPNRRPPRNPQTSPTSPLLPHPSQQPSNEPIRHHRRLPCPAHTAGLHREAARRQLGQGRRGGEACAGHTGRPGRGRRTSAGVRVALGPPCAGRDWGVGNSAVHLRVHGGAAGPGGGRGRG